MHGTAPPGQRGSPPLVLAVSAALCVTVAAFLFPHPFAWGLLTLATFEALSFAAILVRYTRLERLASTAGWVQSRFRIVAAREYRTTTPANLVLGDVSDPVPWSRQVITLHKPEAWLIAEDGGSVLVSQALPNEWVIAPFDGHGRRVYGATANPDVAHEARFNARTVR